MQSQMETGFEKRILFYWAQTYSKALKKGDEYGVLPKIYSISFLDFNLIKNQKIHSVFQLREKDNPEILLTNDLEFHIIELKKLKEHLANLNSEFESWLFTLKNGHELNEEEMNTLVKKNQKLKKVFKEYESFSSDPKNKSLLEARRKSQLYINTQVVAAKKEGIEKGKLEGKLETALDMLHFGISIDQVCKVTGLTEKQILDFKKDQVK